MTDKELDKNGLDKSELRLGQNIPELFDDAPWYNQYMERIIETNPTLKNRQDRV